jgi:hypothetical protein
MRIGVVGVVLWAGVVSASAQVSIEVGSLTAGPGDAASFEVSVRTSRDDVGGTGNRLLWDGPFEVVQCTRNPDVQREATAFGFIPAGCRESGTCTSLRALVLSFGIPELPPPLADGDVLYTCEVSVRADAADGNYAIACSDPDAATLQGVPLEATCLGGVLTVLDLTPTPTATSTPTVPLPSPTNTVAAPTATATALPCSGDCDGNRVVSIEELVAAVRVALGQAGVAICPAANSDGGLSIEIQELIRAVRNALDGCP